MNLYPYQTDGVAFLSSHRSAILADDPGLGKTAQALRALGQLTAADLCQGCGVLIVCPASVRNVWRKEWQRWAADLWMDEPVITSYEGMEKHFGKIWTVAIFDEAHFLKNPSAKRTKAALGRTKWDEVNKHFLRTAKLRALRHWFLTGTPITTCPANFFSLLHFCAPAIFPDRHGYEAEFCEGHFGNFGWEAKGATRIDKLRRLIKEADVLLRRRRQDVLTQLPPKTRQIVELPKPTAGDEADTYRQANLFATNILDTTDDEAFFTAISRSITYTHKSAVLAPQADHGAENTHDLRKLLAPAKVAALKRWLADEDFASGEGKLLIWAHYHTTLDAISLALEALGIKHGMIDGRVTISRRDGLVDQFQTDPSLRALVCGIGAAGTGITLTAANRAIFVEASWVPAENRQAEDRCHRIGQVNPVLVQYLTIDGSYDSRILRVLAERMSVIQELLGG